jgi:hypothetical protein
MPRGDKKPFEEKFKKENNEWKPKQGIGWETPKPVDIPSNAEPWLVNLRMWVFEMNQWAVVMKEEMHELREEIESLKAVH